jgi:hypothetical protein
MLNYKFLLNKYCPELQCDCIANSYDGISCYDSTVEKPSQEQFEEWWEESKEEYFELEAKRKSISDARKLEYPPLDDLIVALWEKIMEDNEEKSAEIQKVRRLVKEKYQDFIPVSFEEVDN